MATPRYPVSTVKRSITDRPGREPDVIIGEFQRGIEIGKGSFATVYIAKHRTKKSLVAIKVVPQSKLNEKLKANLKSEIRILTALHHPHIVALFNVQETPHYFYLIMEYCHMSDLAHFMKKRRSLPDCEETADIFRRYPNPENGGLHEVLVRHFLKQIVSALEALHVKHMIHRDIKPQNLLLNPSPLIMAAKSAEVQPLAASQFSMTPAAGLESLPMLKIADFGFARHLPSTSMAETLCGSPLYMAPEILRYERYGAKADLWSTGTVLHEMIMGKPPFRANNHVELARKIEHAQDVIPFDKVVVSRDLKNLTRALLKRHAVDRISYEALFVNPVITGDIPGLVPDDLSRVIRPVPRPAPVSGISRGMASQAIEDQTVPPSSSDTSEPLPTPAPVPRELNLASRPKHATDAGANVPSESQRRKSSAATPTVTETQPQDIRRQSNQFIPQSPRRPSIVGHFTAPGRQELHVAPPPDLGAPKMERRPSRSSPLAAPPMVREPSSAPTEARIHRDAQERTLQDMQFEKEYVLVEKNAVMVNALADEMGATRRNQGAIVRRATTQGMPTPGSLPSSYGTQGVTNRTQGIHQRASSFERRYGGSSPQSATNMISNAIKAANARLFRSNGKGPSPPSGYSGFPAYTSPALLPLGEENEDEISTDEDTKIVRIVEEAAHRSDVIYSFAEVKYKQLVPAVPSARDGLGIRPIGGQDKKDDDDKDMTIIALVGVAEEALVLYVKALNVLTKIIDLAGIWWNSQARGESHQPDVRSGTPAKVSEHMNSVVQWARDRFNECLEKSEVVGRRLQAAQTQLPEDNPGHPSNHEGVGSGSNSSSTGQIYVTNGVTAERLMFDRAWEMNRAAAIAELLGEDLKESAIQYETAIRLMEATLDRDHEPLLRRLQKSKSDKHADEDINGLDEKRESVVKMLEGARARLHGVRKSIRGAQQSNRRASAVAKPGNGISPSATPSAATPPR